MGNRANGVGLTSREVRDNALKRLVGRMRERERALRPVS